MRRGAAVHRLRDHRGQAAVEFAMLFPFVLFLIMFLIEFGLVLHVNITVNNSAREAVRFAAVTTGLPDVTGLCLDDDIESIEERAVLHSRGLIDCDEVTVTYMHTDGVAGPLERGDGVVVTITHVYDFLTPFGELIGIFTPDQITVGACADGRLENALSLNDQQIVVPAYVDEGVDCT